jgi:hypothetical protein
MEDCFVSNLGDRIDREIRQEIRRVFAKFPNGAPELVIHKALRAAGVTDRYWDGNKDLATFTNRKITHDWHWRQVTEITKHGKIIRGWIKPPASFTPKQAEEAAEVNKGLATSNAVKCNALRQQAAASTGQPVRQQLLLFEQAV